MTFVRVAIIDANTMTLDAVYAKPVALRGMDA